MIEEEKKYLFWLSNTTNNYRGQFTNTAIIVEQIIDEFLCWYFIGSNEDKRMYFYELILGSIDMTFSQKIRIFTKIVSTLLSNDFDKYKNLLPKLEVLRKKRNEFAHSKIDSRPTSINNNYLEREKIHLLKVSDFEIKTIILDISILERQLNEYGQLAEDLSELLKEYIASETALPSESSAM